MAGKHSRTKGHSFERFVANALKPIFPNAKRHLESQMQEAEKGIDIEHCGPYGIQCKAYKQYSPILKINEVNEGVPVLITKGDQLRPVACMYLDDWIELVKIKEIMDGQSGQQLDASGRNNDRGSA